jgi:AcrR family transcriptional regulator
MGRPPRALLTKDTIMRAALAIVDDEGAAALSTNRIAARLGVKGASLYNHVAGRDEILEGIRELLVAEMDLAAADLRPWTTALDTWARSYRAVLAAHPNAVLLLVGKPIRSMVVLRAYAKGFDAMRLAGWPEHLLFSVIRAVECFLLGSALDLAGPPVCVPDGVPLPEGLLTVVTADHRAQAELTFEIGLAAMIDGLTRQLAVFHGAS